MAYETLTQMTTNMLDPVRGWWDERQLSRVCASAAGAVVAGEVGYLDTLGKFAKGNGVNKMPLFARGGTADNDARRIIGNVAGQASGPVPGNPSASDVGGGVSTGISCLVGTGPYELGTTAYDGAPTAGSLLMGKSVTVDSVTTGKIAAFDSTVANESIYLTVGTAPTAAQLTNTNQVIGIATSGVMSNQYGKNMVYFYVNWWPAL